MFWALLFFSSTAFASSIGYKDYATNYVIGFLVLCSLIIFAQFMTALGEPGQAKSAQEIIDEMEKK